MKKGGVKAEFFKETCPYNCCGCLDPLAEMKNFVERLDKQATGDDTMP